jgi:hypothetical protein
MVTTGMQQMMNACIVTKKEFDALSQAFKLGVTGSYYRSPIKLPKKVGTLIQELEKYTI